ncbi:hypothetical protein [Pseudomonas sessilinigenes]|uniref:Uncharacterized protein n=1 Tax=Pseudomonas sessilinigenes TaxID=658629 RepID=A0ABX8MZC9_9PSED|nr:hypothetical protein [Pseudomonas sessilinigenes]AZC24178.1 hypothetical protein C4K39_2504 [Pseudomonas sessilinigenes]QXH43135.1 hypothetical protein KSS89_13235 [Pseudomonas sessilinigenes]
MTVSELLVAIRKPYVETLARQIAQGAAYVEPAYRNSDGSLATEGVMAMPCRVDMIAQEGAAAGEPVQVDAESELAFEPVGFAIEQMAVRISPFGWDWLALEVRGLGQEALVQVMGRWFLEWFDVEDENPPTEDALQGVVHFISDPEPTAEGFQVKIDLGSAPAPAVEDLLFALADGGASGVVLG